MVKQMNTTSLGINNGLSITQSLMTSFLELEKKSLIICRSECTKSFGLYCRYGVLYVTERKLEITGASSAHLLVLRNEFLNMQVYT